MGLSAEITVALTLFIGLPAILGSAIFAIKGGK